MMDSARRDQIRREIQSDLARSRAGRVVYLEGKTDPEPFLALLGVEPSDARQDGSSFAHDGVLIRGLDEQSGSGSRAVEAYVEVGGELAGRVVGIRDGDGQDAAMLASQFDPPHMGPLFRWKAYCIENVVAQAAWPAAWGARPDWQDELRRYAPYVALNRMGGTLRKVLADLGLARHSQPALGAALLTESDVTRRLGEGKRKLAEIDPEQRFREEAAAFRSGSLVEMHARLNGKWLFDVFAPERMKRPAAACRAEWIGAVVAAGGSAEIKSFWTRLVGSAASPA